jgi:hypothetical protein
MHSLVDLEGYYLVLTLLGLCAGSLGIIWARTSSLRLLSRCGMGLFVATLLVLGADSLLAASQQADNLPPLGLSAGTLVVLMLWEVPQNVRGEERT